MSELPTGWGSVNLFEICRPRQWKTISTRDLLPSGYVVYGANGEIGFYSEYTHENPTVMITCRGATCGNIHISKPFSYINGNAMALDDLNESVSGLRYVNYFLRSRGFEDVISGSAQPQITGEGLRKVSIPIAPLPEQKRIADKLDAVLARVDACRDRLDCIPTILKRFRQSVLAAACSGRLTADWREKNPDVAPKCYSERSEESRFRSNDETRFAQGDNDEDQLPESWIVTALENLCEGFQYGTSAKSQKSGKVPVLRMGNIQNGKIDWTDLAYTSDEDEINKFILRKGDVLFNRTNSPELVGKTGIYKGERPAIFAGYLIRIKNYPDLNSEYLNYCLSTVYAREFCQQVKTDGVSQSNVNAQKLGEFPLPLSPNNTK